MTVQTEEEALMKSNNSNSDPNSDSDPNSNRSAVSFASTTTFKNEQEQQQQKQSSSIRTPSSTDNSVTRITNQHSYCKEDSNNSNDNSVRSNGSNGSNLLPSSSTTQQLSVEERLSCDLKDFDKQQQTLRLSQPMMNNPYQNQKQKQQQPQNLRPGLLNTGQRRVRSKSQVFLPRLVNRNMPFHQSKNRIAVFNLNWKDKISKLLIKDWFHVLLRVHIVVAVFTLILIWTVAILVWAAIYQLSDNFGNLAVDCGLGKKNETLTFAASFAFAMETATTVGYGLPSGSNGFFEQGCAHIQAPIYFQMVFNMLFNAFMFAFFYSQLSKSETRSVQLVFSNKLIIGVKDDQVYASVRCYDLDSANPLVEAHARMYMLDHRLKLKPLRIVDPDDDNGAFMHLSIPQEIIHEVDHYSALSPRSMPLTTTEKNSTRLNLRSVDSTTGSRDAINCPICGETFATYRLLQAHCDYSKMIEEREEYPIEISHRSFVMPDITPISLSEVQQHVERTLSEIVVVVEAIDPQLSGTFQALQSYKYDDIEFGADFEHCMSVKENKIAVDMERFHNIKYDPENSFYDCIACDNDNGNCIPCDNDNDKGNDHDCVQKQYYQEEE